MNNLYHVNINLLPLECHQALQDFVAIFPFFIFFFLIFLFWGGGGWKKKFFFFFFFFGFFFFFFKNTQKKFFTTDWCMDNKILRKPTTVTVCTGFCRILATGLNRHSNDFHIWKSTADL